MYTRMQPRAIDPWELMVGYLALASNYTAIARSARLSVAIGH